ncbi:MAG TPA: type II secretion system F family protein [Candidatus Bilamarchaeaceae archaeon]|nr:type II secretion system F family protein [Candidatus Bilamarchaeaceae archaeon]
MRVLLRFSQRFPAIPLDSRNAEYGRKLERAYEPHRYVGFSLFLALVLAILFITAYGFGNIILLPIAWAGLFLLLLMLPKLEFKRYVAEVERELPFALRDLGTLLDLRLPFSRGIQFLGKQKSALGQEFDIIYNEVKRGVDFSRVVGERARYLESTEIKRAFAQLISAYEEGSQGKEMKRLGDELLLARSHRLREYAGKSALIGLLFIVTAAILPTFFLVMVGLGGTLGSSPWPPESAPVVMLVVFPLLMMLVALLGKAVAPHPVLATTATFPYTPLVVALPVLAISQFLEGIWMLGGLLVVGIGIGLWLYPQYKKEKRLEEVESQLPDGLLLAGGLPAGSTLERVLQALGRGGEALGRECDTSLRQLRSHIKPETVLADFIERNKTAGVERSMALVQQAVWTNRLERLHEIADDLLKILEIQRQRAALLAMQKYTLILGALLVPLILTMALELVENMRSFTQASALSTSSILPAYILVYALLGGYYIAELESKPSNALLYFVGMGIVGMATLYGI